MFAATDARKIARAMKGQSELEAIGSAMISANALDEIATVLTPKHFADERAAKIFEMLLDYRSRGEHPSLEQLAAKLSGDIDAHDLFGFADSVLHGFHADFYAKQVLRAWQVREWAQSIDRTNRELQSPSADIDEILNRHARDIDLVLGSREDDAYGDGQISDLMLAIANEPDIEPIETGLFDLDVLLDGGFEPGQLVCVGARPSVGKSALCGGFALSAAQHRFPSLYMFWEMTAKKVVRRFQQQAAATEKNIERLNDFAAQPLFARSAAGWSIDKVESEVRRYVRRHGVRFVVLDYLGLIGSRKQRQKEHENVADVVHSLQRLAMTTGVVLVVAQQLSRDIEKRAGDSSRGNDDGQKRLRPRMSDFRDSGSVEQDADILIAIDRPVRPSDGDRTKATLHILKNRNGEVGQVDVHYSPERTLFHVESPGL